MTWLPGCNPPTARSRRLRATKLARFVKRAHAVMKTQTNDSVKRGSCSKGPSSGLARRISHSARVASQARKKRGSPRALPATSNGAVGGALDDYFRNLKGVTLVSAAEEHELARRYKDEGDRAAADRLVRANLRLVVRIANEYARSDDQLMDLIQEGNIGLLHALGKFDLERGVKLSSYAAWWIRAYILKFVLSNFRMVRLGKTLAQRRLFYRLRSERARLEREGTPADCAQLAQALSVRPDEVADMQQRLDAPEVSIDALAQSENGAAGTSLACSGESPDVQLARHELQQRLRSAVERIGPTLTERERQILTQRLLCEEPKTLRELGVQNGVTRERARQQECRLKEKLRLYLVQEVGDLKALADAA